MEEEVNLETWVTGTEDGKMIRCRCEEEGEYAFPWEKHMDGLNIKAIRWNNFIHLQDEKGVILKSIKSYKDKNGCTRLKKYDKHNMDRNKKGHELAMELVYPLIFKGQKYYLEIIDPKYGERDLAYDKNMATDIIAHTQPPEESDDSKFECSDQLLIQERVLAPHDPFYEKCVTISVTYPSSQYPCEWYRIGVLDYFVWLYYCPIEDRLVDYVVVHRPLRIKELVREGKIKPYKCTNKTSGQIFYAIPISQLEEHNLIVNRMYH